jgi:hypothetical protein
LIKSGGQWFVTKMGREQGAEKVLEGKCEVTKFNCYANAKLVPYPSHPLNQLSIFPLRETKG